MSKVNPFRIEGIDDLTGESGVYKIFFKKRYFIWKGKSLQQSVLNIAKQIDREFRSPKDDSILLNVIAYLKRYPVNAGRVEILLKTDDIVELLMCEYEALKEAKNDENCFNTRFDNLDYFPNWITQAQVLEFKNKIYGVESGKTAKKDVLLRKYVERYVSDKPTVDKIVTYVLEKYR